MPFTPQPTNNTPETKVTTNTMDIIAENDIYLKERADLVDSRLGQEVNASSTPNFENVTLNGMSGTVEGRIETNASNISSNDADITTNTSNISTNASNISSNDADISTLQTKTPQSYKTTDSVTFNSVNTDNVAIKQKLFTGTTDTSGNVTVSHGLDYAKILGIKWMIEASGNNVDMSYNTSINGASAWVNTTAIVCSSANSNANKPYKILLTYYI